MAACLLNRPAAGQADAKCYPVPVSSAEFCLLEKAWRELFASCSYPTPFASWEWVSEWQRHFLAGSPEGKQTHRLLLLTVTSQAGGLIGLAPFYYPIRTPTRWQRRDLRLLGDLGRGEGLTEEPILLLRAGCEEAALRAIRVCLARLRFHSRWDLVNLRYPLLPAETGAGALARPRRSALLCRERDIALLLRTLPATWETFRVTLSKSMRDNLAYYPRLLTRHGHAWRIREATEPAEVACAVDLLVEKHHQRARSARGPRHTDHLPDAVHRDFLKAVMPRLAAQGMASLLTLEVMGQTIAALALLANADTLLFYYSGFDPAWYDYSPITILTAEAIKNGIARGIRRINFLENTTRWKRRWGAQPQAVFRESVSLQLHPLALLRCLRSREPSSAGCPSEDEPHDPTTPPV